MSDHNKTRIPVYHKGRFSGVAIVSEEDFYNLSQWLWHETADGYVYRYSKPEGGNVRMARWVLGLKPGDGLDGDHINGNRLDNRRENLRAITRAQNISNRQGGNRGARSKHRGVHLCKQTGRWAATVTINRQCHWLGRHDTEEEAARVASEFRALHMPYSSDRRVETEGTPE